jgi:hypothetical protein
MKIFRNPKLSLILSFLVLFSSCNLDSNLNNLDSVDINLNLTTLKIITIEDAIAKHVKLSNSLLKIMVNNKNNSYLEELTKNKQKSYYKNQVDFKKELIDKNFINTSEIISLTFALNKNLENFLVSNNYDLKKYDKNELIIIIAKEIKLQKDVVKLNLLSKVADPCLNALDVAIENCGENFAIQIGASVVIVFFTFGYGTLAGIPVSTGLLVKCCNDAGEAYKTCKGV